MKLKREQSRDFHSAFRLIFMAVLRCPEGIRVAEVHTKDTALALPSIKYPAGIGVLNQCSEHS